MLHIKYLTTAGFIRSNTIVRWLGTRSEKLAVNSCSTFGIYVGFSFAFCEHFEFMFVWPIYNLVHVNLLFLFAFNLLLNMKILQRNSCIIVIHREWELEKCEARWAKSKLGRKQTKVSEHNGIQVNGPSDAVKNTNESNLEILFN